MISYTRPVYTELSSDGIPGRFRNYDPKIYPYKSQFSSLILQNSVMNPPSFDLSILLRVNTASRHAIRALLACSDLQSLLNLNSTYRRIIPILVRTLSFKATIR